MATRPRRDRRRGGLLRAALATTLLGLTGALPAQATPPPAPGSYVSVSAAASLMAPLAEAHAGFLATEMALAPSRTPPKIRMIYGSSGALARQLMAHDPSQVFISADGRWMDAAAESGRLVPDTRRVVAGNSLVLAAPAASTLNLALARGSDLQAALAGGRLVTADPDHAPLGAHARAALQWLGAWTAVAPRLVRVADAAQARVLVERGAVAAGILYASDVTRNPRLRTLAAFPRESHSPVVYEIALVRVPGAAPAKDSPAWRYVRWLTGKRGRELFVRHGFLPASAVAAKTAR